ncbi:MAG: LacI family DNA-binding transcriptional regulator [Firmicutes bacterium]|nr:LacI family DNA-binding transcriptional regulator [Bacillota bacterium]
MATIKDVAKRAGVSVSAVSRALNGYSDINADTKARILQVVEELRYFPKASARHLVTQKSFTIGVHYPSISGPGLRQPFIAHVLDVFKNYVGMQGYDVIIFCSTSMPFIQKYDLADRVRYRDVDGVLLLGPPDESIDLLVASEIPVVGVDFATTSSRGGSVNSDNRRAIHEVVLMLHANGYSRFAFAHGPLDLPVSRERLQGFYGAMAMMGMQPKPEWVVDGDFTVEGGVRACERILSLPEYPDVIVCSADGTAIGVLQTLQKAGVKVPDIISVTGFDDIDGASFVYPQLTTIRQDKDEIGRLAAQMMLQLIEGNPLGVPMYYTLPTRLIVRGSTRPLPVIPSLLARDIQQAQ